MGASFVFPIKKVYQCGRGDLNPYAHRAPPPQDGVSANFTTSAMFQLTIETTKLRFFLETTKYNLFFLIMQFPTVLIYNS